MKSLKAWNDRKRLNFKGNFKIWKITMVKVQECCCCLPWSWKFLNKESEKNWYYPEENLILILIYLLIKFSQFKHHILENYSFKFNDFEKIYIYVQIYLLLSNLNSFSKYLFYRSLRYKTN